MKENTLLSYAKGITNLPSEFLSPDGSLSECVNLEVKNEQLVPMEMPTSLPVKLASDELLLMVHKTKSGIKNYVTRKSGRMYFRKAEDGNLFGLSVETGEITSIQYLGNTIIAYDSNSPHYILYKDGEYKYLGTKIPEIGLSFNLVGKMVMTAEEDIVEVNVPSKSNRHDPDLDDEDNQTSLTNQVIPIVNKFIAEESEGQGKFLFPFLVRYAYQLYDGTYIMQSSPALMLPSTTMAPICGYRAYQDPRPPFKTFAAGVTSYLSYRMDGNGSNIKDWSDIVSNISVFVTPPIRTYDQNGSIKSFSYTTKNTPSSTSKFYGNLEGLGYNRYSIHGNFNLADSYYSSYCFWDLPQRDIAEVYKDISNASNFYKYTAISLSDASSGSWVTLYPEQIGVNPVSGIETQERLPDDYMTHDILLPKSSFVYNGRLNISNIERHLFEGYSALALTQAGIDGESDGHYIVYTFIKTSEGTTVVKAPYGNQTFEMYGHYLFYPDTDAYRMVIHDTINGRYADVLLSTHSGLNGAVYFNGFNDLPFKVGTPEVAATDTAKDYMPNKLFTSEVNNPFRFPLEGIYTIGTEEIIGMSAVTRPISQGQFGEYPLMAFCTDGNYALRVDSEGYYAAISPIQEDVVLGPDKITPLENSVVIITKKGIMLTSGNEMTLLTERMNGKAFDNGTLPDVKIGEYTSLVEKALDVSGFKPFVEGARMAFDYASNRLLIYNVDKPYSYLYNFDNDTMTKFVPDSKIVTAVIDYPDYIVQDATGQLYSLYNKEDVNTLATRMRGLAITKSLKLGHALSLKSIVQVKNMGTRTSNDSFVKYMLFGSNDDITYVRVGSLKGKPYKYYRLALYTYLLPKESFSGTAVVLEERRNHKLR